MSPAPKDKDTAVVDAPAVRAVDRTKPMRDLIDEGFKDALTMAGTAKDLTPVLIAASKWEEMKWEMDGGKPAGGVTKPAGSALEGGDDD